MQVISAIEAKVKQLLEQKANHQSLVLKLAADLEMAKNAISKIEGALEAFAAANTSIKSELGIVDAVSASKSAAKPEEDKPAAEAAQS